MKMEPIRVKELPIEYSIDKDLLRLISEANAKYGEYKACLKNMDFDSKFFLDSIILTESFKSTQIEGTQISQDDMYYLKYMPQTDDNKEIQNLKSVINYSKEYLKKNKEINLMFVNDIHKILLDSVRGNEKNQAILEIFRTGLDQKDVPLTKLFLCHQCLKKFQYY